MPDQAIDIGDKPRFSVVFTVAGVATDPTTVVLKLRKPDGTFVTYTWNTDVALVRDSAGRFHADHKIAAPGPGGRWKWHWEGTGAVEAVDEGEFLVRTTLFV